MFPARFERYIEVFGGGGWVLFGKPPDQTGMEVYNDFNSNLTNLFYCVKNRTWAFLRELGFLPVNSRDESKGAEKGRANPNEPVFIWNGGGRGTI